MQLPRLIITALIALNLFTFRPVLAAGIVRIDTPRSGEAVQGVVNITGSTLVEGFQAAEAAFAYESDPQTWFLIQSNDRPVEQGVVAVWDTTTIADGIYLLRVKVSLQGGASQEALVSGVQVRNYTAVGSMQAPASQGSQSATFQGAAGRVLPTPTQLPKNPAAVDTLDLSFQAVSGVVVVLILFGVLGIYLGFRRLLSGH